MSSKGLASKVTRFPYRGGNWTNSGNAGLGALNFNNSRANTNSNIGFRPASDQISQARSGAAMAASPAPDRKDASSSARAEKTYRAARAVPRGKPAPLTYLLEPTVAKTINGLFEQIITFDALHAAYLGARKGKRKSWPCRHFERDLEGNLIQLQNELIWGMYRTGGYRYFEVLEPKRRRIAALSRFRDRVVQHALYTAMEPIWEARFISDSYACRPGKGTHAGADRAQGMMRECLRRHGTLYALKADISRYFASIDHDILKGLLRRKIGDRRILKLLDNVIDSYHEPDTPGCGIPIGNLTSQLMANIYLDALDQFVKCRRREAFYLRYMDDFVVLHPDKKHLHGLRLDIERWLGENLALRTNHKTAVFPVAPQHGRGLDFLGYHLWPHKRRLRKASLKRFKRRVRRLRRHYAQGRIDHATIRQQLASWVAHAKHGDALPAIANYLTQRPFRRES